MTRFRVKWGTRALGVAVLVLVAAASLGLALSGGAPAWTWGLLGFLGGAAAFATAANFVERVDVDDEGLRHRRAFARGVRSVRWAEVHRAVDHEGRTWFVEVEGQRSWVLDQLDGHEALGLLFQAHGVPVDVRRMPRLWDRNPVGRG